MERIQRRHLEAIARAVAQTSLDPVTRDVLIDRLIEGLTPFSPALCKGAAVLFRQQCSSVEWIERQQLERAAYSNTLPEQILATLTEPMNTYVLAQVVGAPFDVTLRYVRQLKRDGQVVRDGEAGVWRLAP